MTVHYLIDTSALTRLFRRHPELVDWDEELAEGLVGICPITELEVLFSATSRADRADTLTDLQELFPWVLMPDRVYQRAAEVQQMLTDQGTHRCASPVDLLVAATAELNGLTLLHYDRDFDVVSRATGQAAQWLALPGSIP